ncbi:hypothetical protein [Pseudacidovorax intermedius]|uniref:hypothetical protein n=1 Tax=Pseudacidovorax intermedius TaxID=433924 RepID=UPI00128EBCBD|nr:hypothetical protein [Pseudacidovorax intermedius]
MAGLAGQRWHRIPRACRSRLPAHRQGQAAQRLDDGQELAEAVGADAPVENARLVANADHHGLPTAGGQTVGLAFEGGQYLVVFGQRVCPVDQIVVHRLLSGCHVALLKYLGRYLRRACHCAPAESALWLAGGIGAVSAPALAEGRRQKADFRQTEIQAVQA